MLRHGSGGVVSESTCASPVLLPTVVSTVTKSSSRIHHHPPVVSGAVTGLSNSPLSYSSPPTPAATAPSPVPAAVLSSRPELSGRPTPLWGAGGRYAADVPVAALPRRPIVSPVPAAGDIDFLPRQLRSVRGAFPASSWPPPHRAAEVPSKSSLSGSVSALFHTVVGAGEHHPWTGASPPVFPTVCAFCSMPLLWLPPRARVACPRCALHSVAQPRTVSQPVCPAPAPLQPVVLVSNNVHRALVTEDYRWDCLRQHPVCAESIVVCRGSLPVAVLPRSHACWLRARLIAQWSPLSRRPLTEADVAASAVGWALDPQRGDLTPPPAFCGDSHVFAPWEYRVEPGYMRPAALPPVPGPLHFSDPATSAFYDISEFGSPLRPDFFAHRLPYHPLSCLLEGSVRFGFPLLAEVPRRGLFSPNFDTPESHGPLWDAMNQREFGLGAFISADDWPRSTPLRIFPWFGVPKDGGTAVRGVGHLSFGKYSLNAFTHRGAHPRAALSSVEEVVTRILYLQAMAPHETVMLSKWDIFAAFRQCGIPARDFFKAAHIIDGRRVANARIPMGAVASGDNMSMTSTYCQDVAAYERGLSLFTYIDDWLTVSLQSTASSDEAYVTQLMDDAGLPNSAHKHCAPTTSIDFLGVHIDTVANSVSITASRRAKIVDALSSIVTASAVPDRRKLQSLVGTLQFVAAVIPFGRTFIKSLYRAIYNAPSDGVLSDLREDARMWITLIQSFDGVASFSPPQSPSMVVHAACDASKFGYGFIVPDMFIAGNGQWSAAARRNSAIGHREAMVILELVQHAARQATGRVLVVWSDNESAVNAFSNERCTDPRYYLFLRILALLQIHFRCRVVVRHIAGLLNRTADYLSRHMLWPEWMHSYQVCRSNHLTATCLDALR